VGDGFDELYELAADLTSAPAEANRFVKKAIQYTATEIKRDWQQGAEVSGDDGLSDDYHSAIDYDMKYGDASIGAEIGPNLGRRGGTAGFLEDSPGDVTAPAQHAGRDALRANEDDFYRGLEIALHDATKKAVEK
jgi:hypothetical protein